MDELLTIRETGRWAIAELAARGCVVVPGRDGLPALYATNPTPEAAELFMAERLAIAVAMGANQLILGAWVVNQGVWGEEEAKAAQSWLSYHRRIQLRCGCIQTDPPCGDGRWLVITPAGHNCRLGGSHGELVEMAELEQQSQP